LGAICSLSPELFLEADFSNRTVVTRPIKGTRPDSCDDAELRTSEKDAAELAMIVDLMRNDLGRVCEFGSVRVTDPQTIERHARSDDGGGSRGVIHGVATIEGRLRKGVGLRALIAATFPPGSVTGAPKVRAMQIIDEFEKHDRGPYCGAIGFVSDSGCVGMNVAIRTASILGDRPDPDRLGFFDGRITFPVGAGLVADSIPESEWRETLDKAAAFVGAMNRSNT
jgi:para-aminobenzoate synthetase component 1